MIVVDAPPTKTDPLIGAKLTERYLVTRRIGEGGMGTVYEAEHVVLGKRVAVKVLREKYLDRPEVAHRLVQEARLASSIHHEHIVDITDSGTTGDGRSFVVMELLDGRTLAELIRSEGALPEARTVEIVRQVAGALAAAHERRIVHRDVKPENIFLVARNGQDFVKVVDFGISKSLRPDEPPDPDTLRLTHTGMVLGTPLYMSPEQARGEEDLDHRIDIYALGVILYECLTGEVPFRGNNYLGIIAQVIGQEPPTPRALRPELRLSEGIERVTLRAMAKSREQRYPTMAAFEADLGRVLAGDAIAAAPAPSRSRPSGSHDDRRLRWQWPVAAALVLAGAVALFFAARAPERVVAAPAAAAPSPPPSTAAPFPSPSPSMTPPPAVGAPPSSVLLRIESEPDGAEVREGNRVFGTTNTSVLVPRSDKTLTLTFVRDGYEAASVPVVPSADQPVRVKLTRARPRHAKAAPPKPAPPVAAPRPAPAAAPARPRGEETLPNPY
jgi:serine/threonine-protein kinase